MTVARRVYEAADDWSTPAEILAAMGGERSEYPRVAKSCHYGYYQGWLERRFRDGVGNEYRRSEGARQPRRELGPTASSELREAIRGLLADGRGRTRGEVSSELGAGYGAVSSAIDCMRRSGEVVPDGGRAHSWRLA